MSDRSGTAARVVITGGPHAGKTTCLNALKALGHQVVPEAALELISALNARLGVERQVAWRRRHAAWFQALIANAQLRREREVSGTPRPVFFDRGLLDGLAYAAFRGVKPPPLLHTVPLGGRYTHVFVLDPIEPFSTRSDSGRTSDEAASRQLTRLLAETYAAHGYHPIRVPQLPVEERLGRITAALR